jgi:hypothetical protein
LVEFTLGIKEAKSSGFSLTAKPDRGVVGPGETVSVQCTLASKTPAKMQPGKAVATVRVRGGEALSIGIRADIGLPDVEFVTDEVDFGVVHVGSVQRCPLKVRSQSVYLRVRYSTPPSWGRTKPLILNHKP